MSMNATTRIVSSSQPATSLMVFPDHAGLAMAGIDGELALGALEKRPDLIVQLPGLLANDIAPED